MCGVHDAKMIVVRCGLICDDHVSCVVSQINRYRTNMLRSLKNFEELAAIDQSKNTPGVEEYRNKWVSKLKKLLRKPQKPQPLRVWSFATYGDSNYPRWCWLDLTVTSTTRRKDKDEGDTYNLKTLPFVCRSVTYNGLWIVVDPEYKFYFGFEDAAGDQLITGLCLLDCTDTDISSETKASIEEWEERCMNLDALVGHVVAFQRKLDNSFKDQLMYINNHT